MQIKNKFEDSVIMKAFSNKAMQNGWIKQEVVKVAAEKDYTSTGDLSIDIIKLANSLRDNGQHEYAKELELNYIKYVKAAAARDANYGVTKGTGDEEHINNISLKKK